MGRRGHGGDGRRCSCIYLLVVFLALPKARRDIDQLGWMAVPPSNDVLFRLYIE